MSSFASQVTSEALFSSFTGVSAFNCTPPLFQCRNLEILQPSSLYIFWYWCICDHSWAPNSIFSVVKWIQGAEHRTDHHVEAAASSCCQNSRDVRTVLCIQNNVCFLSMFLSFSHFLPADLLQLDLEDEVLFYCGESDSEHPSSALASLCLSFLPFSVPFLHAAPPLLSLLLSQRKTEKNVSSC